MEHTTKPRITLNFHKSLALASQRLVIHMSAIIPTSPLSVEEIPNLSVFGAVNKTNFILINGIGKLVPN